MNGDALAPIESTLQQAARCLVLTADALNLLKTIEDPAPALAAWAEVVERQATELGKVARALKQG